MRHDVIATNYVSIRIEMFGRELIFIVMGIDRHGVYQFHEKVSSAQ